VRSQDPELPVNNARTMDTRIADSLIAQRSPAIFGGLFSGVALLLTALGAYGVLSYAVAQRRREIGVRIALGARPAQVRGEVLRAGLRLIAIGIALGIAGAWAAGRSLHALFAGLPQAPVGALAIATVVMVLVCLTACLLPARHAARLSPMDALAKD
jgi:ABC-type antimicrobial peptide transport system permease subunit